MRRHPVGYRYAYALYEIARDQRTLDGTLEELEAVLKVTEVTNLFDKVFQNPKMTDTQKKQILTDSFSKHVSNSVLNLLLVMIDNKRESLFHAVVDNFKQLAYEQQGIAEATVYSVKKLTDQEEAAIASVFSKRAGKARLLIDNVVDAELIGGLKVHIGDTVYDGSVQNQLARIQTRMIHGNVSR